MEDNRDLLDLCRLNLMEENIVDSPAVDKGATLQAIDWKKRQLVVKIKNQPIEIADGVMKRKGNKMIDLNLNGDGCWPDLVEKLENGMVDHVTSFKMSTLPDGTTGSNPTVSIRIDLPNGRAVVAEATLKEFLLATDIIRDKYHPD